MSLLTDGNLLPFRQYNSEGDVLQLFALDGTGLNGQLVAIETGSQDPANGAGAYTTLPVAAAWTNVTSYRYNNPRRVRPTQAGDTNFNTIGVTLHTTAVYDENGNLLANMPYDQTLERGFVQTGFTVPILIKGLITLKTSQIIGTPFPGYAAVISTGGAGKIESVNPVGATLGGLLTGAATYSGCQVVGKFISYSGSSFGGYAQILLDCSAGA
jgi:hypothetical protein